MSPDPETLAQFRGTVSRYVRDRQITLEERVAEEDAIPEDVAQAMHEKLAVPAGLRCSAAYAGTGEA